MLEQFQMKSEYQNQLYHFIKKFNVSISRTTSSRPFCCRVWSLLLQFCQLIVNKIDENPNFCENIVFIDEAGFDRNRIFSTITIFINGLQKIPK